MCCGYFAMLGRFRSSYGFKWMDVPWYPLQFGAKNFGKNIAPNIEWERGREKAPWRNILTTWEELLPTVRQWKREKEHNTPGWTYLKAEFSAPLCWVYPHLGWWNDWSEGFIVNGKPWWRYILPWGNYVHPEVPPPLSPPFTVSTNSSPCGRYVAPRVAFSLSLPHPISGLIFSTIVGTKLVSKTFSLRPEEALLELTFQNLVWIHV